MNVDQVYDAYLDALKLADRRRALAVIKAALGSGVDIRDIYLGVFQPAMYEVGRLWQENRFTIAQEHMATAITQSVMTQIYEHVRSRPAAGRTLVATCIGGELHELGIRMVSDLFEMEGWSVLYLGANVPTGDVVGVVGRHRADLVAISITVGGKLEDVRALIRALKASPGSARAAVMVGGQPFNEAPELYKDMGADVTAPDAREAVARAAQLFSRRRGRGAARSRTA